MSIPDYVEIVAGIKRLNELSNNRLKAEFRRLRSVQKEEILRLVEADDSGEEWLTLVMGYTIEAYVGDPVHGGNPNGIAWQWLGHSPGSPRPSVPLARVAT
jgi:gluconate 2-dehydrogenase gamma chain